MGCEQVTKPYPVIATGCLVAEGYSNSVGHKTLYLGGARSPFVDKRAKVTQILLTDLEVQLFADWWMGTLDFGYHPFQIAIPYFGVTKNYVVRMVNDLIEKPVEGTIRKIELDLVLLD